MSKQHRFLTILLVLVLCISMMVSLIACAKVDEETDAPTDSGKIINNGNFELTSSTTFPKTPSSWTGAPGSTATDNETKTDDKSLSNGVISVNATDYDKNKKKWSKPANPGKVGADDNILMINNKIKNSYKYTSSSFSLSANKYYEMSASVRTDITETDADGGAFMGLTGDTYVFYKIPNTAGRWENVKFYFKTSNISSNSVSMWLSLGSKGLNDGMLAKGHAYFDNIVITEMAADTAAEDYKNIVQDSTKGIFKSDMTLPDANFENISGNKAPYSPSLWSGTAGSGNDGSAPTGNDYLEKGIIDVANPGEFVPGDNFVAAGDDTYVLAIYNKQRTAYGYRSDKRVRFEAGKYYKISIDVATYMDDVPTGSGAFIRLKSGTGVDEIVSEIPAINTTGTWQTANFYVAANAMRNKDLYIEVFLGKGGKNDGTLISGKAFFDNIKLETITNNDYENAPTDGLIGNIDLRSEDTTNLIENANGTDTSYFTRDEIAYKNLNLSNTNRGNDLAITPLKADGWNTAYGAYPGNPNEELLTNVAILQNNAPAVNIYKFDKTITVNPNKYYRMGVWVKTADIPKELGVNVALYGYNTKAASNVAEADKYTKLSSFDNINTIQIKDKLVNNYNDYVELVFYVEGALYTEYTSNDKEIFLQLSLGNGHNFESTKHARGIAYFTGFTMLEVNYTDYSSETGDYIKKHSFKSSSYGVGNGGFDEINKQATAKVYAEKSGDEGNVLKYDDNGALYSQFGLPASWTYSDESYLKKQIDGGIINTLTNVTIDGITSNPLLDRLNAKYSNNKIYFDDEFYSGFQSQYGTGVGQITANNNPNLLVVSTKQATSDVENNLTESVRPSVCGCEAPICETNGYCDGKKCAATEFTCAHKNFNGTIKPWGFTSPSMSLTANSYYKISVWAYVHDGEATVSLKSSTKETPRRIKVDSTVDGWQRVDFYVQTGFESLSVNLELFLGDMDRPDIAAYSGTVFFDMPTISKVDEDTYTAAQKVEDTNPVLKTLNYSILTFDNVTANDSTLDTPVGWTGSHRDEDAPKEDKDDIKDVVSGVYNIDRGSSNWFGRDDKYTIDINTLTNIYKDGNTNALVINNTVATEYMYSYSLPKSLTSKSYYKISIDVLTYKLAQDQTANISMKLENSTYQFAKDADNNVLVNTSTYAADGSETVNWRTYTFYIQTPEKNDITNVKFELGLGNKGSANYVAGFAFFDNLNITKIDADKFPEEEKPEGSTDSMYDKSVSHRIVFTDADVNKKEPEEETKSDPLLWLYITSGIIGGLLVIAVGVVLYRKVIKKHIKVRGKKSKPVSTNKNTLIPTKKNNKPSDGFKD